MRIHLGCGAKNFPGFVHVDIQPFPHVDHVAAVDRLPFFADGCASLIYASHVLEHFGRHEVDRVLREWVRVLAPGGTLRIAVPDFEACVEVYPVQGLQPILGLVCGGQRDEWDLHKMIFDERSLRHLLIAAGLRDPRRWDWRTTEHASIDDYAQAYLPHMDKDHGRLMSLNLEATKP